MKHRGAQHFLPQMGDWQEAFPEGTATDPREKYFHFCPRKGKVFSTILSAIRIGLLGVFASYVRNVFIYRLLWVE
jgi:hypothetical protein